ncbi:DUF4383 domain-containing protein [Mycobacterium sp. PS03-16]|uniref:DUF4383 domain-containing protein n=1 Tax=Mycobacterium sp. PS03-16 TaxID=2559611 RepID=UPI00107429BB|nr:DUF4383 domain-containing protein [Mycobacterium sp. PS03-16]TFV61030.1 DUF4383 domain-containing protein [Mycobacterium sp. PS03-16]
MAKRPLMAVQGAALILGAGYLLVGVLGFIPGITADHHALQWAGQASDAELLGIFGISGVHNVVHLVLGVAGLACARTYAASRAYFLAGGIALLGLWFYRLAAPHSGIAELFPLNRADSWLHLGLGIVMVLLALTLAAQHDPTKPRNRARNRARAGSRSRA